MAKIALVHDYLNEFGGAERVLLKLSQMYPDAPIYTLFVKENSAAAKEFRSKKIIQSWFSHVPFADKLISPLRFLIPFIWPFFDFSDYDLVITSSAWAVTKGMRGAKREISYIHTPPRYLYGYEESKDWSGLSWLVKVYGLLVNHFMRMYDFNRAQKPDVLIANSQNISRRIKKFYNKTSDVIYPPIEYKKFSSSKISPHKGDFFLTGGRLVRHKNFDKIIQAFNQSGRKLLIFGTGSVENSLKNIAEENIEFMGRVSEEKLVSLYKGAKAFIVASRDEDLGMTQIEAKAAGCPVIAYKAEGYLETIIEGKTGVFMKSLQPKAINKAVEKIESTKWDKRKIKAFAKGFSKEVFEKKVKKIVDKNLVEYTHAGASRS